MLIQNLNQEWICFDDQHMISLDFPNFIAHLLLYCPLSHE